MSEMKDFIKLKEDVERKRQEINRAEGALEQTLKQLKDIGCSSLEEAKKKAKQLKTKEETAKEEAEEETRKYREDFNDRL
jgi:hypothetical protein